MRVLYALLNLLSMMSISVLPLKQLLFTMFKECSSRIPTSTTSPELTPTFAPSKERAKICIGGEFYGLLPHATAAATDSLRTQVALSIRKPPVFNGVN